MKYSYSLQYWLGSTWQLWLFLSSFSVWEAAAALVRWLTQKPAADNTAVLLPPRGLVFIYLDLLFLSNYWMISTCSFTKLFTLWGLKKEMYNLETRAMLHCNAFLEGVAVAMWEIKHEEHDNMKQVEAVIWTHITKSVLNVACLLVVLAWLDLNITIWSCGYCVTCCRQDMSFVRSEWHGVVNLDSSPWMLQHVAFSTTWFTCFTIWTILSEDFVFLLDNC